MAFELATSGIGPVAFAPAQEKSARALLVSEDRHHFLRLVQALEARKFSVGPCLRGDFQEIENCMAQRDVQGRLAGIGMTGRLDRNVDGDFTDGRMLTPEPGEHQTARTIKIRSRGRPRAPFGAKLLHQIPRSFLSKFVLEMGRFPGLSSIKPACSQRELQQSVAA